MEIPSGLPATVAAIQRGQARFDRAAEQVVADATSLADPAAASDGDTARSLVGMDQESLINGILYGVFRRQQDQQSALVDLVKPAER
jgi:hypothetical protein